MNPAARGPAGEDAQAGRLRALLVAGRWREFARFLFFGTANTLLAYAIYLALLLVLPYPVAYTISYTSGIFISYCLNARFVFHEKLRLAKALQYPSIYAVQYVLGMAALYLLIEVAGMSDVLAPFVVAILMVPVAYHLSRYVIKRPPRSHPGA